MATATFAPFAFQFGIPTPPRGAVHHVLRPSVARPGTVLKHLRFAAASLASAAFAWIALAAPWFLVASQ